MISASDILKILDKIPEWVGLKAMLRRIADLEERVAKLEAQGKKPSADQCNYCGGVLRVIDEKPHPHFGVFGQKILTLTCENCGKETTRNSKPT